MTPDPDIIEKAVAIVLKGGARMLPFNAGDAPVEFGSRWGLANAIAAFGQSIRDEERHPYTGLRRPKFSARRARAANGGSDE